MTAEALLDERFRNHSRQARWQQRFWPRCHEELIGKVLKYMCRSNNLIRVLKWSNNGESKQSYWLRLFIASADSEKAVEKSYESITSSWHNHKRDDNNVWCYVPKIPHFQSYVYLGDVSHMKSQFLNRWMCNWVNPNLQCLIHRDTNGEGLEVWEFFLCNPFIVLQFSTTLQSRPKQTNRAFNAT